MSDDNLQQDSILEDNQSSTEQLQADLDTATNNWKRALADFENYKRRKEGESKELIEFAREVTVAKLLPTIDALEQALRHMPKVNEELRMQNAEFFKQYENWQTGVSGIVNQLDKVFADLGVKKIEAVGKKFDPHFHEAVREVESEGEEGFVVEEFQTGFELNGKVIRPSQVVISKRVVSSK
jgi:molecular chaperone GrpE